MKKDSITEKKMFFFYVHLKYLYSVLNRINIKEMYLIFADCL